MCLTFGVGTMFVMSEKPGLSEGIVTLVLAVRWPPTRWCRRDQASPQALLPQHRRGSRGFRDRSEKPGLSAGIATREDFAKHGREHHESEKPGLSAGIATW